ncbi:MAG: peptide chain release factor N(5)-glutamine methyltransferase [Planctomycetota bacterium]
MQEPATPTGSPGEAWTISRLLNWTRDHLASRAIDEPRLAAEVLLAHAASIRRIDLYTRFDRVPEEAVVSRFRESVRRAARNEPIAYLVGEKEFFSLPFFVTPDVLIPRPDTETLVECVLDHFQRNPSEAPTLLDVGTGSGCIAISILRNLPSAAAVASDVSEAALAVARRNAERHGLSERIRFVQADGFDLPASDVPEGRFDALVCNPPYIAADAVEALPAAVRDYEPHLALTDRGDGLSFYSRIAAAAPTFLTPTGLIAVEIADDAAEVVLPLMAATGKLEHQATLRDRGSGRQRVMIFRLG